MGCRADDADPSRLEGRAALVTGGARGIGAAIARRLAKQGASVAVADLHLPDDVDEQTAALQALGAASVSWHRLDVRDTDSCADTVRAIAALSGGIDVVVNNADVNARHDAASSPEKEWTEVLDVNLTGTFRVCLAALPILRESSAPAVVNLGSTAGAVAVAGSAAYGVSKAAIMHLTLLLALEWAPFGIRVNAVAPTIVPTDMTADVLRSTDYMTAKLASIPSGG